MHKTHTHTYTCGRCVNKSSLQWFLDVLQLVRCCCALRGDDAFAVRPSALTPRAAPAAAMGAAAANIAPLSFPACALAAPTTHILHKNIKLRRTAWSWWSRMGATGLISLVAGTWRYTAATEAVLRHKL